MNADAYLDILKREAERASGEMRAAASELVAISELLPDRGSGRAVRLQLAYTADRLEASARLLIAEVMAGNPSTATLVTRIGMNALKAGAKIGLAVVTGFSGAAAQVHFDRYLVHHTNATDSLSAVRHEASRVTPQLLFRIDDELDAVSAALKRLAAREPELAGRSVYQSVIQDPRMDDRSIDRFERIDTLSSAAISLQFFNDPNSGIGDDSALRDRLAQLALDIEQQGALLEDLRYVLINTIEVKDGPGDAAAPAEPTAENGGIRASFTAGGSVEHTVTRAASDESLNIDSA